MYHISGSSHSHWPSASAVASSPRPLQFVVSCPINKYFSRVLHTEASHFEIVVFQSRVMRGQHIPEFGLLVQLISTGRCQSAS